MYTSTRSLHATAMDDLSWRTRTVQINPSGKRRSCRGINLPPTAWSRDLGTGDQGGVDSLFLDQLGRQLCGRCGPSCVDCAAENTSIKRWRAQAIKENDKRVNANTHYMPGRPGQCAPQHEQGSATIAHLSNIVKHAVVPRGPTQPSLAACLKQFTRQGKSLWLSKHSTMDCCQSANPQPNPHAAEPLIWCWRAVQICPKTCYIWWNPTSIRNCCHVKRE